MFSRKKKYDLSNVVADSSNGYHGNDRDSFDNYTSSNDGETLSRRKEQRRSRMFGSSSNVMSGRSSNYSLNRKSSVPLQDLMATETRSRSMASPIFEQGTPLTRMSNPYEMTRQSSNESFGQKINATRVISDSKVDYKISDGMDRVPIHRQSLELRHQSDELKVGASQNETSLGPTNIDDVVNSLQDLNLKSADTTFLNTSLDTSTSDNDNNINNDNNNNNNNNNNNVNIVTNNKVIQEIPCSLQSKSNSSCFSLTNGQDEIKSLRQLRKWKPINHVLNNIDSSKPPPATTYITTQNTTTTTTSTISTIQPSIDSPAATAAVDKFELQTPSTNSTTTNNTLSSLSQSSSDHLKFPSELKRHENQEIDEVDNPKRSTTTNNFTTSEEVDEQLSLTMNLAPAVSEDVAISTNNVIIDNNNVNNNINNNVNKDINNIITNIDDECQNEIFNEDHETHRTNKMSSNTDSIEANEQSGTNDIEEYNSINSSLTSVAISSIDSNIYLQNNGVSKIIISNDKITITRADNTLEQISQSNENFRRNDNLIKSAPRIEAIDLTEPIKISNYENKYNHDQTQAMNHDNDDVNDDNDDIHNQTSKNSQDSDIKNIRESIPYDIDYRPNTSRNDDALINNTSVNFDQGSINNEKQSSTWQYHQPTIGKFKLNAGSLNFSTKKEPRRYKDGGGGGGGGDDDDCEEHDYFKRRRQETIEGRDGSFRGVKNTVRSGISTFANNRESQFMKIMTEQSKGKIIFFTTSMSVIRSMRDICSAMKKLLQNHRIYFEERDVYISDENAKDLIQRFRMEKKLQSDVKTTKNDGCGITSHKLSDDDYDKLEYEEMLMKLPRVFVEDFDLGSYEEVFKLNETGILKKIFDEFPKVEGDVTCAGCGGFRYTPCHSCHGSKRSRSNAFTEEFFSLRCTKCDENGLARCRLCNQDQTSVE